MRGRLLSKNALRSSDRRASESEGRFNEDDASGIIQRVVFVGVHPVGWHPQHHRVRDQEGRDC